MPRGKQPARDPYSVALGMLARRPYSIAELRRALERKFSPGAAVSEAIIRLRSQRYLDDRKFAEHYASSLARNRAFGRYRIRRELKAKLVNYSFIEEALARAFEDTDERESLERVIDKKLRTVKFPVTVRKLDSLCRSLLRLGFASGDIMKAVHARPELKPVANHVDELDLEANEDKL